MDNVKQFIILQLHNYYIFQKILMNRIVKFIFVSFLLFMFFVSIGVYVFARSNFVTSLSHQGEHIKIQRDQYNIPQIHAPSFRSAMYAWGYVQAEDRLFQLAFRRVSVKGQLSQYLGSKALDIDKMFREINLYGWAYRSAQRLFRENRTEYQNFKAFAQGINDYERSLTFKPLQFYMTGVTWSEWTVSDIFALYKLLKWSLSFGMSDEYIRSSLLNNFTKQQVDEFLPYEPKYWLNGEHATHTTIVKDDQIPQELLKKSQQIKSSDFKPVSVEEMQKIGYFEYLDVSERASNSWAISGNLTDTGHPLLCNDPHLESALPGQWHQVRLFYRAPNGEQVYIMGGAAVGLPLVVGKTTYGSISITTNYVDTQDLFKQKIQGDKYYLDGEWKQLKIRKEIIKIKGSESIEYNVYQTHRGPIIKHIGSRGYLYKISEPISLVWTGYTDAEYISLVPYIHMAEVRSFNEMQDLLADYTDYGPPFNFVYITKDNHIGYMSVGVIPIRKNLHSGMYIKDGTSSENDWVGLIRGTDKLHVNDPKRGYIVTANNKGATDKYFSGVLDYSIFTGRANRLEQLIEQQLSAGRKLSKDFMKKLQLDTVDPYCLQVVKGMKSKLSSQNPTYKFVFSIFENFDCDFHENSTTASFYLTFLQNIYEEVHPEGKNPIFALSNFLSYHQYLYKFILKQHSNQELKKLNNSMFDSLKQLRVIFNSENPSIYKYGQLHKDLMIHRPFSFVESLKRFFEREGPGFGNWNTPNVGYMNKFHEKDYRTNHRANIRLIMSYFEDSQWIIDGGTSQKFFSKHYRDQTDLFMGGKYILMDSWNRTSNTI